MTPKKQGDQQDSKKQPPASKADKAKPTSKSTGPKKGERPIADVDRKVRGGDA